MMDDTDSPSQVARDAQLTPAAAASILRLPDPEEGRTTSVTLKVRPADLELAELVARKERSFRGNKPFISGLLLTRSWNEIVALGAELMREAELRQGEADMGTERTGT